MFMIILFDPELLFVFLFIIYYVFFLLYIIYLFIFSVWDGAGSKDRFFHWGWGMGVEALIRKNTRVLGGAGHYNLCWPE